MLELNHDGTLVNSYSGLCATKETMKGDISSFFFPCYPIISMFSDKNLIVHAATVNEAEAWVHCNWKKRFDNEWICS